MTDDELRRRAQAWVERTTIEQGVPVKIDNPLILDKIAQILCGANEKRGRP